MEVNRTKLDWFQVEWEIEEINLFGQVKIVFNETMKDQDSGFELSSLSQEVLLV